MTIFEAIAKSALHPEPNFEGAFDSTGQLQRYEEPGPLKVWYVPTEGKQYFIGAHVCEGTGVGYSTAVVLQDRGENGCVQVATYKSSVIDPLSFAEQLNWLGRYYHDALIAPEVNRYDSHLSSLLYDWKYPNVYRWQPAEQIAFMPKIGWETNVHSTPRLVLTFKMWLDRGLIKMPSDNLLKEVSDFYHSRDVRSDMDGDIGEELRAAMIALFCGYEHRFQEQNIFQGQQA